MITALLLLCMECIKISLFSKHSCIDLLYSSLTISIKAFKILLPFLPFKGLTYAYIVKISMGHNEYLTFLFFEDNDPISAKSAAQILSLNLT